MTQTLAIDIPELDQNGSRSNFEVPGVYVQEEYLYLEGIDQVNKTATKDIAEWTKINFYFEHLINLKSKKFVKPPLIIIIVYLAASRNTLLNTGKKSRKLMGNGLFHLRSALGCYLNSYVNVNVTCCVNVSVVLPVLLVI